MVNRRSFLQRLGVASLTPVVGSLVLTNPFVVAGPSGVLVPDRTVATPRPSSDEPLLLATDTVPQHVKPIEAWVMRSNFEARRMTIDQMALGDLHRAIIGGPTEVRIQLDLLVKSDVLSREQLKAILFPQDRSISLWVQP